MVRELKDASLEGVSGLVRFRPEFDAMESNASSLRAIGERYGKSCPRSIF